MAAGPPGPRRDHRPVAGSRARASRSGARSPAWTWPRSTRSSTWTRWARSTTRRASPRARAWHPHRGFETVTYIIDGDLPAPGLQRRRRPDHQRRHAVDDRRRRDPAHRGAARGAGGERRPVPRLPALGQPAARAQDGPAALPGHPGRPGRPAQLAGRRVADPRDRRRGGRARRPRRHAHADLPAARDHRARRPAPAALAGRLQRARLRAGRLGHRRRGAAAGADRPAGRVRPR